MTTTIQARLSEARKAAGKTQGEIAKAVGIAQATYSELERGESQSSTKLAEIAFYLGINPHWLATGKGPRDLGEILSEEEREILVGFRTVPPESQALLLAQFRALRDQAESS